MSAKHNSLNDSLLFIFLSRQLLISFFLLFQLVLLRWLSTTRVHGGLFFVNWCIFTLNFSKLEKLKMRKISSIVTFHFDLCEWTCTSDTFETKTNESWQFLKRDHHHQSNECKTEFVRHPRYPRWALNNIILLFWMTLQ